MKRRLVVLLFINLESCLTPSSLEDVKASYMDFLTGDSITFQKAEESGVIEKINNAKTQTEVLGYWEEYTKYSRHYDSIHGIVDGKVVDSVKYLQGRIK